MGLSLFAIERYQAAQKHGELEALEDLLHGEKLKAVLEIGTFRGGTLWMWCRLAEPDATIVSVDLPGGEYGGGYDRDWRKRIERFPGSRQSLTLFQADSHEEKTRRDVEKALKGIPVDFMFIDGDHTYEGVKADFEDYTPLLAPGGLVAFHDIVEHDPINKCGVDRLWDELGRRDDYEVAGEFIAGERDWGGIGVLRKRS